MDKNTKNIHLKVQVVVLAQSEDKTKVLLLRTNKRRGLFIQNVTGSVDPGEGLDIAAKRELEEETGLLSTAKSKFQKLSPLFKFIDQYEKNVEEHCYLYYLKYEAQPPSVKIDESEHSEFNWTDVEDVNENTFKYPSNYEVYLKGIEYLKKN